MFVLGIRYVHVRSGHQVCACSFWASGMCMFLLGIRYVPVPSRTSGMCMFVGIRHVYVVDISIRCVCCWH